jgi:hypothetical protein
MPKRNKDQVENFADIETMLASLKQLRLHQNDKETVRRAVSLKMKDLPVSAVRDGEFDRLPEHMDTLTASFLADCQKLTLADTERMELKTSLLSYMQAKPRAANVPVISYLSVLGTITMDAADKAVVRDELVAAMRVDEPIVEERHDQSVVTVFASLLCGGRNAMFA